MSLDAAAVVRKIGSPPKYHERVDRSFLPIGIRQNRIEDIFTHFLRYLAPEQSDPNPLAPGTSGTVSSEIFSRMIARPEKFRIRESDIDAELVTNWIASELLVESKASNRSSLSGVSVKPLHIAVGHNTTSNQSLPNYGGLLCDLLLWRAPGNPGAETLESLRSYFSSGASDLVGNLIEGVLWTNPTGPSMFESQLEPGTFVRSVSHGVQFRNVIDQLMNYSGVVSRRTMVNWLYSLMVYFLATYFLRMANAASVFSSQISALMSGRTESGIWCGWDNPGYAPSLGYERKNLEHSRLFKQYPFYTSTLLLVSRIHEACYDNQIETIDPDEFLSKTLSMSSEDNIDDVLNALVENYPDRESRSGGWRLSATDKAAILNSTRDVLAPFQVLARHLNFEDMSRQTNNVFEWQFYSTLARDPNYGFARPGRGDQVIYRLSDNALAAFVHCYASTIRTPNFSDLIRYLEEIGFVFDSDGLASIQVQLVENGFLDDLSDAGEGKLLVNLVQARSQ